MFPVYRAWSSYICYIYTFSTTFYLGGNEKVTMSLLYVTWSIKLICCYTWRDKVILLTSRKKTITCVASMLKTQNYDSNNYWLYQVAHFILDVDNNITSSGFFFTWRIDDTMLKAYFIWNWSGHFKALLHKGPWELFFKGRPHLIGFWSVTVSKKRHFICAKYSNLQYLPVKKGHL